MYYKYNESDSINMTVYYNKSDFFVITKFIHLIICGPYILYLYMYINVMINKRLLVTKHSLKSNFSM